MKIKAKFIKVALVMAITFSLYNCSKSDDPATNPEVNPLSSYLAATGFSEKTTNFINLGTYEFGLSFKPIVNGKITAFVVKIPDTNAALRMTIWNKTTATVLRSETINYATPGVEVTKEISGLDVVAGTEYFVTINSNDWYEHKRNDSSNITYPIVIGDLSITGYAYIGGTAQAMPTIPYLSYYGGDISFKFQKS